MHKISSSERAKINRELKGNLSEVFDFGVGAFIFRFAGISLQDFRSPGKELLGTCSLFVRVANGNQCVKYVFVKQFQCF